MANFISEDSYLGDITDPLTLNRYNYVKGSPLNYVDPSGHYSFKDFVADISHPKIAGFLYGYGALSRVVERLSGYKYDPDPTHSPTWFDSDYYESMQNASYITNSSAYLFGLTGGAAHSFEEEHAYTIGEMMSAAAESSMRDLCEVKNALQYAANTAAFAEIARMMGFVYDKDKNIYYTRKDSIQHLFGFNDGIDYNEFALGMNLNALPIEFVDTNNQEWRLELWNGQYGLGLSTGAEVGLYKYEEDKYLSGDNMKHYKSANKEDWIDMSFELVNSSTGDTIFTRSSYDYENYYKDEYGKYAGKDWWLTGFELGEYTHKEDISMEVAINLTNSQKDTMLKGLTNAIDDLKKTEDVEWNYSAPKSQLIIKWN